MEGTPHKFLIVESAKIPKLFKPEGGILSPQISQPFPARGGIFFLRESLVATSGSGIPIVSINMNIPPSCMIAWDEKTLLPSFFPTNGGVPIHL